MHGHLIPSAVNYCSQDFSGRIPGVGALNEPLSYRAVKPMSVLKKSWQQQLTADGI